MKFLTVDKIQIALYVENHCPNTIWPSLFHNISVFPCTPTDISDLAKSDFLCLDHKRKNFINNLASTNISSIKHGLIKKPEIMHESSKLADQKRQDKLQ